MCLNRQNYSVSSVITSPPSDGIVDKVSKSSETDDTPDESNTEVSDTTTFSTEVVSLNTTSDSVSVFPQETKVINTKSKNRFFMIFNF